MTKTVVFEVGTEELPARFIPNLLAQLESKTAHLLQEYRIHYSELQAMATPRRLTIMIEEIAENQASSTDKKRGPSKDIAFDNDGNPTKAAQGFAAGQGVDPQDLIIEEVDGKEYVFSKREIAGHSTFEVLPQLFQSVLDSMNLPVRMFWRDKQHKFLRPIRWLLCLYGQQIVPVVYTGLSATNMSRGHRFLSSDQIEVDHADNYMATMRESWVMVDPEERKQQIKKQVEVLAEQLSAEPEMPEELLEEVNYLVEWPTALSGDFSREFLDLPKEVLVTCMQEHQKFFGLVDKDDHAKLLPKFITVRNGDDSGIDNVRRGNERVLKARLADARFFFEEDTQDTLETKVEQLKSIVYKEKLGSVYDKVMRMGSLSKVLKNILELTESDSALIQRAVYLSKGDLTTQMVDEFPALQGIMGEKYARLDGEDDYVCRGISEHYLPRYAGDELPETIVGTVISIADKIDNIVSSFAIGERPSGSQDPYALRRQAQGIVQIILEKELHCSLEELIQKALDLIPQETLDAQVSDISDEIIEFIKLRVKTVLRDRGIANDVIDSVLAVEKAEIYHMYLKAVYLQQQRESEEIASINKAYTRIKNIADKAVSTEINSELLQADAEKTLYNQYLDTLSVVTDSVNHCDIKTAVTELSQFKRYIDDFFDYVMVMTEDKQLQNNRLVLIHKIKQMYNQIADFSLLQD